MLRTLIVSSLVFGSHIAYGSALAHTLLPKLLPQSQSVKAGECADFSGTWVGQCTNSEGHSYEERMTLTQDGCTAITSDDNETLKLGSVKTETEADQESFTNVTFMPAWNSDKTAISVPIGVDGKGFNSAMPYRFSGKGTYELQLEGEALVTKVDVTGSVYYDASEQPFKSHTACTYARAN